MCRINILLFYAVLLAGLLSACSDTVERYQDGGMDGGANCVDNDGDGYGVYCPLGPDCDDEDPAIHSGCADCTAIEEGCLCEPGSEPQSCYPDYEILSGGQILCYEGTRFCRDGRWSACESIDSYLLSSRSYLGKIVPPTATREAYCWGNNAGGQLGVGDENPTNLPVQVYGVGGTGFLTGSETISGGGSGSGVSHSCSVTDIGELYCWGNNQYGQVGDGTSGNERLEPVEVSIAGKVAQVSAGSDHTCALGSDGQVWCWGSGADGKLGTGNTSSSSVPVKVKAPNGTDDLTGAFEISVTGNHACAITADRNAVCWGLGSAYQLGNNGTSSSSIPVYVHKVDGGGTCNAGDTSGCLKNVRDISAGFEHSCAVLAGGQAVCWGAGTEGRLGNNSEDAAPVPVNVVGVDGVDLLDYAHSISAGGAHTCAVLTGTLFNTRVACWGLNAYGQLGNGDVAGQSKLVPVAVYTSPPTPPQGSGLCIPDNNGDNGHDYWFCQGDPRPWGGADGASACTIVPV